MRGGAPGRATRGRDRISTQPSTRYPAIDSSPALDEPLSHLVRIAALQLCVRCLTADEVDECACGGWGVAPTPPDTGHEQTNGRVQAAHLQGRPLQGCDRPREDRRGEAADGSDRKRNGSPRSRARRSGWPASANSSSRTNVMAEPRRGDRVLGEVGHADVWSRWDAVGSNERLFEPPTPSDPRLVKRMGSRLANRVPSTTPGGAV